MSNDGVTFAAQGKTLRLRFGINALCELEEQHDIGMAEIGAKLQDKPRLGFLRSVFAIGLRDEQPDMTDAEAGEIMTDIGMDQVGDLLGKALTAAFPTAKPGGTGGNGKARAKPTG